MQPDDAPQKKSSERRGFARVVRAFRYSAAGFKTAFKNEAAFRQDTAIFVVLTVAACLLDVSGLERAVLIAAPLALLATELLNSAIEAVVDMTMPTPHPLAKAAKDMGSAAVFCALTLTGVVWVCVLLG